MKHTEGIWKKGRETINDEGGRRTEINAENNWFGLASVVTRMNDANEDNPEGIANLERIIACVNALDGIKDPKKFVELANQHRQDVFNWESTMMQLVGADTLQGVRDAIVNFKSKSPAPTFNLTEEDRLNLCDIVWWMRGYKRGNDNSLNGSDFHEDHLKTLEKVAEAMRDILNKQTP